MTDNPAPFLDSTGKESGHIYERHYRYVEAVTGPDESSRLDRCVDIETSSEN